MNEHSIISRPARPLPADNPERPIKLAQPNTEQGLPHIGLVGDTYTILLSGDDTNGRYCLIDMHIPPGGGPPPHRHDFEESFTLLAGEIEATCRSEKLTVRAGETRASRRTHRIRSPTLRRRQSVCCASVRRPVRRNSSRRSAYQS